MSFLQVVLPEEGPVSSGAEIRNNANLADLSTLAEGGARLLLSRAAGSREGRTVAALDPAGIAALLDRVRERAPRFVLFEGVAVLEAVAAVRAEFPALRLIVDFHNVESRLDAEILAARWPRVLAPLARLAALPRFHAARRADRAVAALADAVWTCSEQDSAAARRLGIAAPLAVVANPVPDWCRDAPAAGPRPGREVLFLGHLGYGPNRRAVDELCRRIMPRLARRMPDARLHVCGRGPGERIRRLVADTGHRLTPDPQDLRAVYAAARVAAMPLRQGGGTRIKVLEALAVGCPIVATAKAVEGLGLVPRRHYLAAETPAAFAAALARVLAEDGLARELADRGQSLVAERYGAAARRDALRAGLAAAGI